MAEKAMTVRKTASKSGYVAQHDPANYPLLKDNRCEDEKFSRVDRYWVNHYYLVGTEWLCEKVFYPSRYGMEQITSHDTDWGEHPCKQLLDRLMKDGIGLMGERATPRIEKPVKRIQLECRPKRMRLECKE